MGTLFSFAKSSIKEALMKNSTRYNIAAILIVVGRSIEITTVK